MAPLMPAWAVTLWTWREVAWAENLCRMTEMGVVSSLHPEISCNFLVFVLLCCLFCCQCKPTDVTDAWRSCHTIARPLGTPCFQERKRDEWLKCLVSGMVYNFFCEFPMRVFVFFFNFCNFFWKSLIPGEYVCKSSPR